MYSSARSEQQPLVVDSVLNQDSHGSKTPLPRLFATRTPPLIHSNTIIVAAASPDIRMGRDFQDGWLLSDFYAFNYLFNGLGHSQTWLTAADPTELLNQNGDYLHDNELWGRKTVLSQQLLAANEITHPIVLKSRDMIERFLQEVREKSAQAASSGRPLLLMVFCHGIPDYKLALGPDSGNTFLPVVRLKEAIAPRCRVTLLTTACHSGGWVARHIDKPEHDALNSTMLATTDRDTESNAWHMSHSLRKRTFGSIFTSSVIDALTSATDSLAPQPPTLQPANPTDEQVMTYNAFCTSIADLCRDEVHRLWDEQYFTFSAQDDQWESTYNGRTGIPLRYFRDRWNRLVDVPYTGDAGTKSARDRDPINPTFPPRPLPSRTGGLLSQEPEDLRHRMTSSMVNNRVATMAELFLETCPGDWDRGWGIGLRSMLRQAHGQLEHTDRISPHIDVCAFINYRWQLAELADVLVEEHDLPMPSGETCILWRMHTGDRDPRNSIPGYEERLHRVWGTFVARKFLPEPMISQGPPFTRFMQYMAASVALAQLPDEETDLVVDKLVKYMQDYREFYRAINAEDEGNMSRKREWMKSIGR